MIRCVLIWCMLVMSVQELPIAILYQPLWASEG